VKEVDEPLWLAADQRRAVLAKISKAAATVNQRAVKQVGEKSANNGPLMSLVTVFVACGGSRASVLQPLAVRADR